MAVARERARSRGELVQDDAEREDVGTLVDGFAFGLLRRHVMGRAKQDSHLRGDGRERPRLTGRTDELGQAEVEHLHVAVRPHHHVFRLDVAMDDCSRMRRHQRAGDLRRDRHGLTNRQSPAREPLSQRFALDEFGDDERAAVEIAEIVNHHDVRMIERGHGTGLEVKPAQAISVDAARQQFERNVALEVRIVRLVDLPHATGAQPRDDAIVGERPPDQLVRRRAQQRCGRPLEKSPRPLV